MGNMLSSSRTSTSSSSSTTTITSPGASNSRQGSSWGRYAFVLPLVFVLFLASQYQWPTLTATANRSSNIFDAVHSSRTEEEGDKAAVAIGGHQDDALFNNNNNNNNNGDTKASSVSPPPPLVIAQLGDSFSSGTGAGGYAGIRSCKRSPNNWGSYVAHAILREQQQMKERPSQTGVQYVNRACHGTVIQSLTDWQTKEGEFKLQGGRCPAPTFFDEEVLVNDHRSPLRSQCTRYVRPQIESAVGTHVDLVMMSVGANDVGFEPVIFKCFVPLSRRADKCRSVLEEAREKLPALRDNLVRTFATLRQQLRRDARVFVVDYPYINLDVEFILMEYQAEEEKLVKHEFDASRAVREVCRLGSEFQKQAIEIANAEAGEDFIIYFNQTKELFAGKEPHPDLLRTNPKSVFVKYNWKDIWVRTGAQY